MNIIIYGTPTCSFCTKAKELCAERGVNYTYHVVGEDITVEALTEMAGQPVRTVPQIFKLNNDGFIEYIGGYQELSQAI